jgi:hypothetical protein
LTKESTDSGGGELALRGLQVDTGLGLGLELDLVRLRPRGGVAGLD